MANGFYQEGMKHVARGNFKWLFDATPTSAEDDAFRTALVDGATDGIIDASDVTFTGTAGDNCEGILVYQDEGSAAADRLFLWWDSASGLPVTLGGDVTVQWDNGANKVAKL